ncbi:DsbA family oxidoreductase [Pectobacterium cacticida]|uniref:DsbA family oxidoreductase n=1 Tax=Pectobacterium cacticida TaxID=69221 RepID=UPI0039859436
MTQVIRIDFVSDVSCTWCAVGLRNLEQALENLGDVVEAEFHFHPFELNPDMPAGGQNLVEHLQEKYGWDEARAHEVLAQIRCSGESVSIDFQLDGTSRIYNTFNAHRLLHWAGLHGKQKTLKQALFSAHFTEGGDPGNHGLLIRLAETVGLDADEARRVLAGDAYAQEVQAQEQSWRDAGVTAVPTVVFNQRYALTGAQPPAAFEQAIRRALDDASAPTQPGEAS